MNVAQAAWAVAHDAKAGEERIGFDQLAEMLGIKGQNAGRILRNKVDLNNSVNHLTLNEAVKMTDIVGDTRILQAWARACGLAVIELPTRDNCADGDVIEMMSESWITHGEIGRAINDTFADGRVEKHEVHKVKDRAWAHMVTLLGLVSRIEGMAEPD